MARKNALYKDFFKVKHINSNLVNNYMQNDTLKSVSYSNKSDSPLNSHLSNRKNNKVLKQ